MNFKVIKHAYGLIVRNFGTVLRIALIPSLILMVLTLAYSKVFFGQFSVTPGAQVAASVTGLYFWLWTLLNLICLICISIWMIVGWHRFVLLEEMPRGFLPRWHGAVIWDYFGRAFFIGLALIIPLIISIAMGFMMIGTKSLALGLNGDMPLRWLLYSFMSYTFTSFITLRLSLGLPAASIKKFMSCGESWEATSPYGIEIFGASLLFAFLQVPVQFLAYKYNDLIVAVLIQNVLTACIMLFGISVLTTLYGVIQETRKLS